MQQRKRLYGCNYLVLLLVNVILFQLRDFQMAKTDCNEELKTAVEESKANNDLVQLLVQEKSKLTDDLQKQELIEKELRSENEELNNRYNISFNFLLQIF